MDAKNTGQDLPSVLLKTRIIVVVLSFSVIAASATMIFLRIQQQGKFDFGVGGVLTLFALSFAIAAPLIGAVVARVLVDYSRRRLAAEMAAPEAFGGRASGLLIEQKDAQCLLGIHQSKTILLVGVLEGAAFLNAVMFLIEGDFLSLIAIALLLIGIVMQFPTTNRLSNWLEDQLRQLREERALAR